MRKVQIKSMNSVPDSFQFDPWSSQANLPISNRDYHQNCGAFSKMFHWSLVTGCIILKVFSRSVDDINGKLLLKNQLI